MSLIERVTPTRPAHIKALCFGEPGSGKTHFISTWPDPILVIVTDPDGDGTLRPLVSTTGKHIDRIDLATIPELKRYNTTVSTLNDIISGKPDYTNYATIAVDTITGLMDIFMAEAMRSMLFPGSSKQVPRGSMGEPTMNHYSGESYKVKETITRLVRTPYNILINMHTRQDVDKEGNLLAIYPFARGSNRAADITRLFNEVYLITTRKSPNPKGGGLVTEHILHTQPTGKYFGPKTSLPNIPNPVIADMEAILEMAYPTHKEN